MLKKQNNILKKITDAYPRCILGHELHSTQQVSLTQKRKKQGHDSPLCSGDYVKKLKTNGIKPSTTQDGSPYSNAIAERVNGILKTARIDTEKFKNIK